MRKKVYARDSDNGILELATSVKFPRLVGFELQQRLFTIPQVLATLIDDSFGKSDQLDDLQLGCLQKQIEFTGWFGSTPSLTRLKGDGPGSLSKPSGYFSCGMMCLIRGSS